MERQRRCVGLESGGLVIGGCQFAFPRIGLNVEAQLVALDQVAHTGPLDSRDMHEHIGATSVLYDEPEAFSDIEKIDGTFGHLGPLKTHKGVLPARTTRTDHKSGFGVL